MDVLNTLRQPKWALPASAVAVCALARELLPENEAHASEVPAVHADRLETKCNHTHGESEAPNQSECYGVTQTTSTTPPPVSSWQRAVWDYNTGTWHIETTGSPAVVAESTTAPRASTRNAPQPIFREGRLAELLYSYDEQTARDAMQPTFRPLVWAQWPSKLDTG
jgi:hypothetical protein